MRTQVKIIFHNTIFLIPQKKIELKSFNERKIIGFQWLFFTIILDLVKRNSKSWNKSKP